MTDPPSPKMRAGAKRSANSDSEDEEHPSKRVNLSPDPNELVPCIIQPFEDFFELLNPKPCPQIGYRATRNAITSNGKTYLVRKTDGECVIMVPAWYLEDASTSTSAVVSTGITENISGLDMSSKDPRDSKSRLYPKTKLPRHDKISMLLRDVARSGDTQHLISFMRQIFREMPLSGLQEAIAVVSEAIDDRGNNRLLLELVSQVLDKLPASASDEAGEILGHHLSLDPSGFTKEQVKDALDLMDDRTFLKLTRKRTARIAAQNEETDG